MNLVGDCERPVAFRACRSGKAARAAAALGMATGAHSRLLMLRGLQVRPIDFRTTGCGVGVVDLDTGNDWTGTHSLLNLL